MKKTNVKRRKKKNRKLTDEQILLKVSKEVSLWPEWLRKNASLILSKKDIT